MRHTLDPMGALDIFLMTALIGGFILLAMRDPTRRR
jgi:hypothetical protein